MRLRGVAVVAVTGVAPAADQRARRPPRQPAPPRQRRQRSTPRNQRQLATPKTPTATSTHGPALAWIRRLQHDLTTLHFYAGPITGIDTAATKTAVTRFQRAEHLKPDGLWGPKSQAALDKMLHRKPSKTPPALTWIRNLQRDLTKLHFYSGPATGVETPATKTAVIRFQHAAHLRWALGREKPGRARQDAAPSLTR